MTQPFRSAEPTGAPWPSPGRSRSTPPIETPGRSHLRRAAKWLAVNLAVLAAITLVAGALLDPATWRSLGSALQSSGIAAVAITTAIAVSLNVVRWLMLWRAELGRSPLATQALFYLSGHAMSATPGRAGELVRLWLNRRHAGIAYVRSLPVFVLDRVADTASVVICGIVGFAIVNGQLELLLPIGGLLALAVAVLRYPKPWLALIGKLRSRLGPRMRRTARLLAALALMLKRTARLHNRPVFLVAVLLASAARVVQCMGLILVLGSVGHDISLALALTAYAAGSLAGAASMLPGGLGAAELAMIAVLVAAGLPVEPVIASVLVFRVGSFWFATGVGIAALAAALVCLRAKSDPRTAPLLPGEGAAIGA